MLLKRGCPPMSHIWGTKAQCVEQNRCAGLHRATGWSCAKMIWFEQWKHTAGLLIVDLPLLSHCLWWPSACWNRLWESCLRWTGLTVQDKCETKRWHCDTFCMLHFFFPNRLRSSEITGTETVLQTLPLSVLHHMRLNYNPVKILYNLFKARFHLIQKSYEKPCGRVSYLRMWSK